jgi:hypothetical protein
MIANELGLGHDDFIKARLAIAKRSPRSGDSATEDGAFPRLR